MLTFVVNLNNDHKIEVSIHSSQLSGLLIVGDDGGGRDTREAMCPPSLLVIVKKGRK